MGITFARSEHRNKLHAQNAFVDIISTATCPASPTDLRQWTESSTEARNDRSFFIVTVKIVTVTVKIGNTISIQYHATPAICTTAYIFFFF